MASNIEYGFSDAPSCVDDSDLVARIVKAYERAQLEFTGHGTGFWAGFEPRFEEIIEAVRTHDYGGVARLLRDPSENELFWGFDGLVKKFTDELLKKSSSELFESVRSHYDSLIQLAVGVGAARCPYPEAKQPNPEPAVEEILSALDFVFGFRIDFPNPYRHEFGLATSRGIASYRAIQALYQTWRVIQLGKLTGGCRFLEIGAGLGRNAYYAQRFGKIEYTIIDIPATQLAQGYFLGRVLGQNVVSLPGENDRNIRIRSPAWFHKTREKFDVALNVDSLTELDKDHALAYVTSAKKRCGFFLSINHEYNQTPAAQIFREASMVPLMRSPYWPRPGYIEELVVGSRMSSAIGRTSRSWFMAAFSSKML